MIIDEIQKLPSLLDDVHDLIESRGFRFVLTGPALSNCDERVSIFSEDERERDICIRLCLPRFPAGTLIGPYCTAGYLRSTCRTSRPKTSMHTVETICARKSKLRGRGLRYRSEETSIRRRIIVCLEPLRRTVDGIEVWPVEEFLSALWGGEFG